MNEETPKDWVDLLSIPIVEYTASVWKKDPAETWGILSRAIQNEEISQHLPLHQFVEYICLVAKIDPATLVIPLSIGIDYKQLFDYHIDRLGFQASREQILTAFNKDYRRACQRLRNYSTPRSLPPQVAPQKDIEIPAITTPIASPRPKFKFDFGLLVSLVFIAGCFFMTTIGVIVSISDILNAPTPIPTPTFNATAWQSTVIAMRTQQACMDDSMAGVPYEYSSCNPNPATLEPPEPYYFDENPLSTKDSAAPCLIKGNISETTGEKIYHLPGLAGKSLPQRQRSSFGQNYAGVRTQRLSHLLYCASCGARVWVQYPGGYYTDKGRRWACSQSPSHVTVKDSDLLPRFVTELTRLLQQADTAPIPARDNTALLQHIQDSITDL